MWAEGPRPAQLTRRTTRKVPETTQPPSTSFGSSASSTLHCRLRNWQSCPIWSGRGDIIEFPKLQPLVTAAPADLIWAPRFVGVAGRMSNCRNCVHFLCLSFIIAPPPITSKRYLLLPIHRNWITVPAIPSSFLSAGFTFDLAMNCRSASVD